MRPTDCVTDTEYPLVVSGHPTEVNVTMPFNLWHQETCARGVA
jgi:hypothetical protein